MKLTKFHPFDVFDRVRPFFGASQMAGTPGVQPRGYWFCRRHPNHGACVAWRSWSPKFRSGFGVTASFPMENTWIRNIVY